MRLASLILLLLPAVSAKALAAGAEPTPAEIAAYRRISGRPAGDARIFGSIAFGDGLRFNNPYRLSTELGDGAESVSRTSSYLDVAASVAFGPANGFQHGGSLHVSLGLEGVKQQVFTPSYVLVHRGPRRTMFTGRLGTPVVLTPDPGLGLELAVGAAYFFTARLALTGELVGDVFYGAGTPTNGITTYPVLSAQVGVLFDYEVLP